MEIKVRFVGGPLHDQSAMVTTLSDVRLFFPPAERLVHAYIREDETLYVYDQIISKRLAEIYDQAAEKFRVEDNEAHLRFVDDGPPVRFSDTPIVEDDDGGDSGVGA